MKDGGSLEDITSSEDFLNSSTFFSDDKEKGYSSMSLLLATGGLINFPLLFHYSNIGDPLGTSITLISSLLTAYVWIKILDNYTNHLCGC